MRVFDTIVGVLVFFGWIFGMTGVLLLMYLAVYGGG